MRIDLSLLILATLPAASGPAIALDLVRDGQPASAIIIPDEPLPVETAAAGELQYHIQRASDANQARTPAATHHQTEKPSTK